MVRRYYTQWSSDVHDRKKNDPEIWVVPNDTTTFSELENPKNKIFYPGHFEDAEAKGGYLEKEADFETVKKFKI